MLLYLISISSVRPNRLESAACCQLPWQYFHIDVSNYRTTPRVVFHFVPVGGGMVVESAQGLPTNGSCFTLVLNISPPYSSPHCVLSLKSSHPSVFRRSDGCAALHSPHLKDLSPPKVSCDPQSCCAPRWDYASNKGAARHLKTPGR